MPPEENKNKNIPLNTFKVGSIDPVFKGNSVTSQNSPLNPTPTPGVFNVLANQKYPPTAAPITATALSLNNPNTPKSLVRTYKGDLESAIQTSHLTSINIAIAENQKMHSQINIEPQETTPESDYSKNKIILFVSLALVIIGVAGIAITYFINGTSSNQATQVQELPALITTEYKDELNTDIISRNKIISTLSSKLNTSQITVNNLINIYLTTGTSSAKRLITSAEFVYLMNFKMPDMIKRSLLPDYMVGMYSFGKNLPFIIIKTSSFENTYAGMLNWEQYMETDFKNLFNLNVSDASRGILAELSPTTARLFQDTVIANNDVRILRDSNNQTLLLYGIINKGTIIVTVNDTAFKEIVNRLSKEAALKR